MCLTVQDTLSISKGIPILKLPIPAHDMGCTVSRDSPCASNTP